MWLVRSQCSWRSDKAPVQVNGAGLRFESNFLAKNVQRFRFLRSWVVDVIRLESSTLRYTGPRAFGNAVVEAHLVADRALLPVESTPPVRMIRVSSRF